MNKFKKALMAIVPLTLLTGCSRPQVPHEHTFSTEWQHDESSHWHDATCEHKELTKDRGAHIDLDGDNVCDVCHYEYEITPEQYLVVFNTNFGSFVEPQIVIEGDTVDEPEDPSRDNYAFYGWYDTEDFSGDLYDFSAEVTSNLTLYARWGYSFTCINYDDSIYHSEVLLDGEIIKPVENPTKENETFIGWYKDKTFEGEKFVFNVEIHENTTIYASFGFSVNFYTHDGSLYKNAVVPEGKKLEAPTAPTKDYHDFEAWYVDEELTTKYNFNSEVTKEFDLYANFTPSFYSITYHGCEGAQNDNPEKYQYTVGVPTLLDATKDGYRFYGWYTDEALTNKVTSISAEEHKNIDLYAYFSKIYQVEYNNWPVDIENPNPTEFTVEERQDLVMNPFTDYPGLTLISYTDNDGGIHVKTDANDDMVLTVNYSATVTHVTFDANGGGVIGLDNCVYLNSMIPGEGPIKYDIPAMTDTSSNGFNPNEHVPEYDGHVFMGWYLDQAFTTPINENSLTLVTSGQTLYAKWEEIPDGIGDIYDGISYSPGWQPRPYSFSKIDKVLVPFNVKTLSVYYFGSCNDGNVVISSNGVYRGTTVAHQIYRSLSNQDFIFDDITYDASGDEAITFGISISYDSTKFDQCLPSYSYTFTVKSYREQYIKAGPQSSTSMDISYWSATNLPYIGRDGYEFLGWYNGNTLVDISTHFLLTDESVTLVAHWMKIS